jgi:hypothetical protein
MENLTKILKKDLTKMDSLNPELNALIKCGWSIKGVLPVTDDGKPYMLVVLEKINKTTLVLQYMNLSAIIFILIMSFYAVLN